VAFGDFFLMISTSCLKKPTQERLRLFHSYAQARRRLIYQPIFKRQRSTLSMLFFGPKNGEHLHRGRDAGGLKECRYDVDYVVELVADAALVLDSGRPEVDFA